MPSADSKDWKSAADGKRAEFKQKVESFGYPLPKVDSSTLDVTTISLDGVMDPKHIQITNMEVGELVDKLQKGQLKAVEVTVRSDKPSLSRRRRCLTSLRRPGHRKRSATAPRSPTRSSTASRTCTLTARSSTPKNSTASSRRADPWGLSSASANTHRDVEKSLTAASTRSGLPISLKNQICVEGVESNMVSLASRRSNHLPRLILIHGCRDTSAGSAACPRRTPSWQTASSARELFSTARPVSPSSSLDVLRFSYSLCARAQTFRKT